MVVLDFVLRQLLLRLEALEAVSFVAFVREVVVVVVTVVEGVHVLFDGIAAAKVAAARLALVLWGLMAKRVEVVLSAVVAAKVLPAGSASPYRHRIVGCFLTEVLVVYVSLCCQPRWQDC